MIFLFLSGCLDDQVGVETDSEFVAFQSDFADYSSWPSWQVADDPVGTTHLTGPRWVFIDPEPPAGATEFPLGTVIVKEARNGNPEDWDIFGMVKRGAGYNAQGAHGWEWFELSLAAGEPAILWRGELPPSEAGYECVLADGSIAESGDCNGCHAGSWMNDYVQDAALQLEAVQ